jgi:large subunit ribosomal protein L28
VPGVLLYDSARKFQGDGIRARLERRYWPDVNHESSDQTKGSTTVAGKCDICGKTKTFGNNVSFSHKKTNRDFRPNVQRKRLTIGGVNMRLNVCTRCMRTLGKSGKAA